MTGLGSALWVEALKARRSRILWITIALAIFMVCMLGFMTFILKDPDAARKYGLIATKARIAEGEASWPSFHLMLVQVDSILGLLGFGFVASWVFGREYSDRTVKDLLALPVSRSTIIASKLIVTGLWCMLLSSVVFPSWLLIGRLFSLPGWDPTPILPWFRSYVAGNLLLLLLTPATALVASVGKGFLAPIGFVIFVIAIVQITSIIGYGQYFPWALPVFVLAGRGPTVPALGAASWIVYWFAVTSGTLGLFLYWRYADQK
jgi:ABC-type transport system involved in multi-copper enzyme maturation permease subunit